MCDCDESDSDSDSHSFYLARDGKGNKIPIKRYRRGEKIEEWLIITKSKIFGNRCLEPVKTLTRSLQPSTLQYAIKEGLNVHGPFGDIVNELREIFRYDGRLPNLTQLFFENDDFWFSDRAKAVEIFTRTKEVIERREKNDLIEETALGIFLCKLPEDLAEEIKKTHPLTIEQALKVYPRALQRLKERRSVSSKENFPVDAV